MTFPMAKKNESQRKEAKNTLVTFPKQKNEEI